MKIRVSMSIVFHNETDRYRYSDFLDESYWESMILVERFVKRF